MFAGCVTAVGGSSHERQQVSEENENSAHLHTVRLISQCWHGPMLSWPSWKEQQRMKQSEYWDLVYQMNHSLPLNLMMNCSLPLNLMMNCSLPLDDKVRRSNPKLQLTVWAGSSCESEHVTVGMTVAWVEDLYSTPHRTKWGCLKCKCHGISRI